MRLERATSVPADGADSDRFLRMIGGRRSHNRRRTIAAEQRRMRVARLLGHVDLRRRGWQAEIACELDVHRGTICRDIAKIGTMMRRQREAAAEEEVERRQRFFWLLARCEDRAMFEVPR